MFRNRRIKDLQRDDSPCRDILARPPRISVFEHRIEALNWGNLKEKTYEEVAEEEENASEWHGGRRI